MATIQHEGATTAQLRDDIDSGRTGDKVDFPDHAAAPLGTDDEAAGTPPHPMTVAKARQIEATPLREKRASPPLAVKIAGAALAALAVFLLYLAIAPG
jgi:hypothetical protein